MRLRRGRERGYGILPLLLGKGGANFMPESGVRRSRRAGTERALHHNAVHPAAVLEADILDGADHAKPLRRVQPDRAAAVRIADDRDHLPEPACRAALDPKSPRLNSSHLSASRMPPPALHKN